MRHLLTCLMMASVFLLVAAPPYAHSREETKDTKDAKDTKETGEDVTPAEESQIETGDITKSIEEQESRKALVPWSPPDFTKQEDAVGWSEKAFAIPPGFEKRVQFWVDIYSKYSTSQALIHDAQYIDIVYKVVDFTDIDAKKDLTVYEKERLKRKRVKEEKKLVREQLERIHKNQDTPSRLSPEDLAVYNKFHFVYEKDKFLKASKRKRLRFQLGQKDRFVLGIYFSGRYIREMEKIFREEKAPAELTRLPFVESSFNIYAYSRVGASGIWQFMRSTGRLFKLKSDSIRDMRNDPLSATRAAAKLLRANFKMLGSWPLALTGYNHGPLGVAKLVKKMGTDDINEIVWNATGRRFGFASENFYAEFLAALEVETHADKYFGKLMVSPPLEYEEVTTPRPMSFGQLAYVMAGLKDNNQKYEDEYEKTKLYNPFFVHAVNAGYRQIPKDFVVRIPRGQKEGFSATASKLDGIKIAPVLKSGMYKILPGDTLSSISHEFGITLKLLMETNNLGRKSMLRPGQKLIIPTMEGK